MDFMYPKKVRLVKKRPVVSNGKEFHFLTIADTETFENCDFVCSKDCDFDKLLAGKDYNAVLKVDGRYSNLHLS